MMRFSAVPACGFILAILFFFFSLLSCKKDTSSASSEKILVRIDDKTTISVNEFIRRAEYTPRPDYCKFNSYIHKKIILNSLIAEKLLALEAGENPPLMQNDEFKRFIKGRREQAMRQWMHHVEATEKVTLNDREIENDYLLAGREYNVAYFSVNDSSLAKKISNLITADTSLFEPVYQELTNEPRVPVRKVTYDAKEHFLVHKALFSHPLQKGQIMGPIKIADDDFLFVKVKGWEDYLAITEQQRQERINKVRDKLTSIKSSEIWEQRVSDIMKGKKLEFNKDIFKRLSELFFKIYFRTPEEKRDALTERIWNHDEKKTDSTLTESLGEDLLSESFFKVDDQPWTVDDFRKELISHPLVFRKMNMTPKEFPKQFRFAIADMLRDHFVTEEAYKKGYDKVAVVQRNVNMWRDYYVGYNQKHRYLNSIGEKRNFAAHYHEILNEKLNPYIDSLQAKYYKQVEVDFDALEEISLTTIDMLVKQPGQPFQYIVPMFPVVTSDNLLEYARKMRK